jgi:hypothetical protein
MRFSERNHLAGDYLDVGFELGAALDPSHERDPFEPDDWASGARSRTRVGDPCSMWHPAYPMGTFAAKSLGCKTAALGYTNFPPGKDSTDAFRTGFEEAGREGDRLNPYGRSRAGSGLHTVLRARKDDKPDCFYVFIPSGSHASAVVKTYGDLGMRAAGIKLIGPMDVVPDSKLRTWAMSRSGP